ncbi:MAG: DNA-formamidopyrimidine glycosylase family protein [Methanobacterium sp.]
MPELAELKIMSDFINQNSNEKTFTKVYHVEKGNNPIDANLIENFNVSAESYGKELKLYLSNESESLDFSVFMGMSGNWKFVPTENWNDTKFVRMRLDTNDGYSLLLYGSYMGPKYKLGGFTGVKRGPDPTKQFDLFRENVLSNLDKKAFDKPICEALLEQKYFNGIGNYLRSTILYYLDVNPFEQARKIIQENPQILEMCRDIPIRAYQLNGGQLSDWTNPFDTDYVEFKKWVFYQKGLSYRDNTGRTFWYDEKWDSFSIYKK